MGKIIDLEGFKRRLLSAKANATVVDLESFEEYLAIDQERLSWLSACDGFKAIELFLNRLFYDNHILRDGRNPDSAFVMSFSEEHMEALEEDISKVVKSLGRMPYSINARGKTFIQMVQETLDEEYRTDVLAFEAFIERFLETDAVVIFKGISKSKIPPSLRGGYLRSIIKAYDDAHFKGVSPQGDLIFIDSPSFLEKIWPDIGEYVKVATFREG